jgi:hypothetical protein
MVSDDAHVRGTDMVRKVKMFNGRKSGDFEILKLFVLMYLCITVYCIY